MVEAKQFINDAEGGAAVVGGEGDWVIMVASACIFNNSFFPSPSPSPPCRPRPLHHHPPPL